MKTPTIQSDAAMALLEPLTELVAKAGMAIMAINRHTMAISRKTDSSPITEADLAADTVIANGLARLAPEVPVFSEERASLALLLGQHSFFLIDPLDGTREFVSGHKEFTVNLALVTDNQPLLGIIGAPALGLIWRGVVGYGAERLTVSTRAEASGIVPISTRLHPDTTKPWVVTVSRSHSDDRTEAFIGRRPGAIRQVLGSAIKFCRVAEGTADIYPRLSPTSEWDVAAGHAIVVAAGGKITDSRGQPLRFGKIEDNFIVPEFIAWGDPLVLSSAAMPS